MPIIKRTVYDKARIIFKLWIGSEKKPRAQFVEELPILPDGRTLVGGRKLPIEETNTRTIPYVCDIHEDEWARFTPDLFRHAMGVRDAD